MFEEFPRIKHELESISKKYKQFFEATASQLPSTSATVVVQLGLRALPSIEPERFIKNATAYAQMLGQMKLLENKNRDFVVTPKLSHLETKKTEIVFSGDTINPADLSITYDKDTWNVAYHKEEDGKVNSIIHLVTTEVLVKFLEFLNS